MTPTQTSGTLQFNHFEVSFLAAITITRRVAILGLAIVIPGIDAVIAAIIINVEPKGVYLLSNRSKTASSGPPLTVCFAKIRQKSGCCLR